MSDINWLLLLYGTLGGCIGSLIGVAALAWLASRRTGRRTSPSDAEKERRLRELAK